MQEMRQVEFVPFRLTDAADIYSIRIDNKEKTEFQEFMINFKNASDRYLSSDFDRIIASLSTMLDKGTQERFLRVEGKFADRIYALPLYTIPRRKQEHGTLRVYCIRLSDRQLILGGGNIKMTQTYDDDEVLSEHVQTLQSIDKVLQTMESEGIDLYNNINNLTISIH